MSKLKLIIAKDEPDQDWRTRVRLDLVPSEDSENGVDLVVLDGLGQHVHDVLTITEEGTLIRHGDGAPGDKCGRHGEILLDKADAGE
jgi:hypothetical protein